MYVSAKARESVNRGLKNCDRCDHNMFGNTILCMRSHEIRHKRNLATSSGILPFPIVIIYYVVVLKNHRLIERSAMRIS